MKIKAFPNEEFFTLLEEELEEKGRVRFRVKGTSMQPFLRDGREEVILKKCGGSLPSLGEICLFRYRGAHVLHRLTGYRNGLLYFRGDNVITRHECCTPQDLAGVVETVVRGGKELPPDPWAWRFLTVLHRLYLRIRRLLGRMMHASGLR